MTTTTQRVAALRQRRKANGLKRVEFFLTEAQAKAVRDFIRTLQKEAAQ